MTKLIGTLSLSAAVLLFPALPRAQDAWEDEPPRADAAPQAPPSELPPAPPSEMPAAPQVEAPAQSGAPVPPGQWVYTQQYGWVWMPYADAYTSVPANGSGEPYAYVYYPAYSTWTWIAAPWVWGIGPWPVFGVYGPARFAWYGHGWWRYPSHWHYAPSRAWGGSGFRPGYRGAPAPYRGTFGGFRAPAAAPRGSGFGGHNAGFTPPRVTGGRGGGFAGGGNPGWHGAGSSGFRGAGNPGWHGAGSSGGHGGGSSGGHAGNGGSGRSGGGGGHGHGR